MAMMRIEARNGLRWGVIGLAAIVAALTITSDAADARHHRRLRVHYVSAHRAVRVRHSARAEGYSPPSASIVVDGNTGAVLQASNPDAPRHPASLTKIMTLYLLFERLDAGKIKLDTPLKISEHASDQDPTKLDLKPGQTIPVEDAIKGVVTRSANDAAVVIAENIGGSEDEFAKLMTQKAHALGMSRTTYVNASGLPNDDQITTARDQALLGRAIQDRFPRYYKYFSLPAFVYHGVAIRNHDHLLGSVEGVDGIKTGFTRASGFNLVTSVHRDGRYVVAVVLGGRSSFQRDAHMRELIGAHIKEASLQRTAPVIAEQTAPRDEPQQAAVTKASTVSRVDPTPTATVSTRVAAGTNDPIQPLLVKTVSYRIAPVQAAGWRRCRHWWRLPRRSLKRRALSLPRPTPCRRSRSLRSSPTRSSLRPSSRTSPSRRSQRLHRPAPSPPKPSRQSPSRRSTPAAAGRSRSAPIPAKTRPSSI